MSIYHIPENWLAWAPKSAAVAVVPVNEIEGNDRMGISPDANCPDDNQSTRSGSDNIPWFLMKSRGMTHGNLRKRPCMNRNWAARVGALRNGKG